MLKISVSIEQVSIWFKKKKLDLLKFRSRKRISVFRILTFSTYFLVLATIVPYPMFSVGTGFFILNFLG
jgi:hypothetical protein